MEVENFLSVELRASGSPARKPVAWNRSRSSLSGQLAVNDGAAGRELHRKPGIVLVVDDRVSRGAQLRLAGHELAERVNVFAPDQSLLDRLQQFDLPVGVHA